jgi:hypothetical protein
VTERLQSRERFIAPDELNCALRIHCGVGSKCTQRKKTALINEDDTPPRRKERFDAVKMRWRADASASVKNTTVGLNLGREALDAVGSGFDLVAAAEVLVKERDIGDDPSPENTEFVDD